MTLLFTKMRSSWVFSVAAAGLGFLTTILTVHFAGAAGFADFTIDFAKLSLLVLLFELVPSPYALFRVQQLETMQADLASFAMAGALAAAGLIGAMAALHLFAHFSWWMFGYGPYLSFQRYLDVKLQAEGRLREYFQLTFTSNLLRALLIAAGFLLHPHLSAVGLLWMALTLGSLLSLLAWAMRRPAELRNFARRGHGPSLARLAGERAAYYPYYANVGLKRIRDAALPVLCGVFVPDRVEVARYLLAYRGVDFVLGQLRVAEASLSNMTSRAAMAASRRLSFGLLAVGGQFVALAASIFLGAQAKLDVTTVITAVIGSFYVYPYVVELVLRSDAYAAIKPHRVTLSLTSFVVGLALVVGILALSHRLTAPTLILAPLTGQSFSALSYFIWRRRTTGGSRLFRRVEGT